MRLKNVFSNLLILLFCAAIPSLAADYNILVKNETSANSGSSLYVVLSWTDGMRTRQSSCTSLRSYGDGSFYVSATMEADQNPKLTFYTNRTCSTRNSVGSVSPFAGTEPVSENFVITISSAGTTVTNSAEVITPPQTNPGGPGTTPGGPGTTPGGPGTTTPTHSNRKVIRFFAPWTNTSAILYVAGGDSAKMTTVKNYWVGSKLELLRLAVRSRSISSRPSDTTTWAISITLESTRQRKTFYFRSTALLRILIPYGSRPVKKSASRRQSMKNTQVSSAIALSRNSP